MLSTQAHRTAATAKKKKREGQFDNQLYTEKNILYKHGMITKKIIQDLRKGILPTEMKMSIQCLKECGPMADHICFSGK